jgi:hypothetical protein
LQLSRLATNERQGIHGKKTAEICPNMTVFADVRNSDGMAIFQRERSLDEEHEAW